MTISLARVLLAASTPLLAAAPTTTLAQRASSKTPIQITADLSEATRKVYHADLEIPVTAGTVDLTTPKWIPGNHRPTGPVEDIVGVVFMADGKPLVWRRDDVDMYEFHVTVPKGVTMLHAHLDCIVDRAADAEVRRARVGEAAALSGAHARGRHRHPAKGEGAGRLGNWHSA